MWAHGPIRGTPPRGDPSPAQRALYGAITRRVEGALAGLLADLREPVGPPS